MKDFKRERLVKSKCMADMLVWLGFEYIKTDDGYLFVRDWAFDRAWSEIHALKGNCERRYKLKIYNK